MKIFKIFIAFSFLFPGVAKAQFTTAELQVSGLTCSMCSKATEKSLRTLDFIGDIKTDLNHNLYIITFKKDVVVNLQAISKKVQNAGFSVNNLKVAINFDGVKLNGNQFTYGGSNYQLLKAPDKINGLISATIVNKGFISPAAFKKYAAQYPDITKTGIYHLTI